MSLLGFPVLRYIDVNDSEEVLRAIQLTDAGLPLDIILHTPGGLMLAAMQIARALHDYKGKVTAFVPHYAMSRRDPDRVGRRRDRHVRAFGVRASGSATGTVSGCVDSYRAREKTDRGDR